MEYVHVVKKKKQEGGKRRSRIDDVTQKANIKRTKDRESRSSQIQLLRNYFHFAVYDEVLSI
jgi:polyhydroxyalkanoate synthesis regulator phasin